MINWKIALYWIIGSFFVGMALSFMVHPDIGSFVLLACIFLGSIVAVIHYLISYLRNRQRQLKQLTPVGLILFVFTLFALYIYISIASCDITEKLSYSAAKQLVKMEGMDESLLEETGREILGCHYIFEYDKGNVNKLIIVDREGNAKFNNVKDSQSEDEKPEVNTLPQVN